MKENQIMKRSQYLDLLASVDIMNVLNGGRSEPQVTLNQHDDHREIRVKIPGIDAERIQVEVHNDHVSIFYMMDIESVGKTMRLPYSLYNKQQPYFIDLKRVNATVEGREMVVKLPYNELASGYHRKVESS
ncbi:Hsp20/alpha crystallin family protein [Chryseolinea sp. T2]